MFGSVNPCKAAAGRGAARGTHGGVWAVTFFAASVLGTFTRAAAQEEPAGGAVEPPAATYWVYVGAESADLIHRVRFGPDGAAVEKTIPVGLYPTEMEGPHGLAISADGKYLHMTTGHGLPDGQYWKIELGPDTVVGEPIMLGRFPATVDVTPDGLYAFVVNFNLHGDHVPSDVSVIYTPDVVEVARVTTCTMPHGSRLDATGMVQYSACMMDDQIVELDTRTFEVSRRFSVAAGAEGPVPVTHTAAAAANEAGGHASAMAHGGHEPTCSPTWAQPDPTRARLYVACNAGDEVLEIDTEKWTLLRRFATGRGPYNLAVTRDGGTLVATLKQGAGVELIDLETGTTRARLESSTKVTHGVAVTPDSRYAFVSVEGIGAEPGKVDIFDLHAMRQVGSVDVGQQAGGIAFWKMEPANP
ncbi:MAG: YncE family protein [Longimicrobiales bacterium]